jgi:(2Fe-2S) ferredoxin
MSRYLRHLFVCENRRPSGHPRGCCAGRGAAEVRAAFKLALKKRGLAGLVRANAAGCLDTCEQGVTVVVYPEGVWYGGVKVEDVEEIVQQHVVGGEVVERLLQPGVGQLNKPQPLPSGPSDATT